jgi:hypothetical protein
MDNDNDALPSLAQKRRRFDWYEVEKLRRAIEEEGPQPAHHRETMARHRREWPTLWAAIDDLLAR